ncbi:MAG: hypothetical protein IPJ85_03170 [Flavobacteriales bacterium]|nr:hypothetical protein [Flavobacteriales bacterium]
MWRLLIFIAALVGSLLAEAQDRDLVRVSRSQVRFTSTAPLEVITAANDRVKGVLDRADRSFAVQVPIVDFMGFNAPLQREHFNENYHGLCDLAQRHLYRDASSKASTSAWQPCTRCARKAPSPFAAKPKSA